MPPSEFGRLVILRPCPAYSCCMAPLELSIKKVLSGDRDAYAAIVAEYQEMLLAYAAFRVPDRALVDEVVQQTFIRAYEQLADYKSDKDFGIRSEERRVGKERRSRGAADH